MKKISIEAHEAAVEVLQDRIKRLRYIIVSFIEEMDSIGFDSTAEKYREKLKGAE